MRKSPKKAPRGGIKISAKNVENQRAWGHAHKNCKSNALLTQKGGSHG